MSHVTLEEIASACAREFGVTLEALRARHGNKGVKRTQANIARDAAVWLARRHTQHTYSEIAAAVGITAKHARQAAERAAKAFELIMEVEDMSDRIARIEQEIDRIHERRIDELFELERRAA